MCCAKRHTSAMTFCRETSGYNNTLTFGKALILQYSEKSDTQAQKRQRKVCTRKCQETNMLYAEDRQMCNCAATTALPKTAFSKAKGRILSCHKRPSAVALTAISHHMARIIIPERGQT